MTYEMHIRPPFPPVVSFSVDAEKMEKMVVLPMFTQPSLLQRWVKTGGNFYVCVKEEKRG